MTNERPVPRSRDFSQPISTIIQQPVVQVCRLGDGRADFCLFLVTLGLDCCLNSEDEDWSDGQSVSSAQLLVCSRRFEMSGTREGSSSKFPVELKYKRNIEQ